MVPAASEVVRTFQSGKKNTKKDRPGVIIPYYWTILLTIVSCLSSSGLCSARLVLVGRTADLMLLLDRAPFLI
jgi:hypothetical protein